MNLRASDTSKNDLHTKGVSARLILRKLKNPGSSSTKTTVVGKKQLNILPITNASKQTNTEKPTYGCRIASIYKEFN
jgi:hypothetical protein